MWVRKMSRAGNKSAGLAVIATVVGDSIEDRLNDALRT